MVRNGTRNTPCRPRSAPSPQAMGKATSVGELRFGGSVAFCKRGGEIMSDDDLAWQIAASMTRDITEGVIADEVERLAQKGVDGRAREAYRNVARVAMRVSGVDVGRACCELARELIWAGQQERTRLLEALGRLGVYVDVPRPMLGMRWLGRGMSRLAADLESKVKAKLKSN